jgi:hypothetical protein
VESGDLCETRHFVFEAKPLSPTGLRSTLRGRTKVAKVGPLRANLLKSDRPRPLTSSTPPWCHAARRCRRQARGAHIAHAAFMTNLSSSVRWAGGEGAPPLTSEPRRPRSRGAACRGPGSPCRARPQHPDCRTIVHRPSRRQECFLFLTETPHEHTQYIPLGPHMVMRALGLSLASET